MQQDIIYLLAIWAAAGAAVYFCENSALLPTPRRVIESLISAVALVVLYLLMRRVV